MARPDVDIKVGPAEREPGLDWFGKPVGWEERLVQASERLEMTMGQFKGSWWHYLCSPCGLAFKQDRSGQGPEVAGTKSCVCPRCGSLKIELVKTTRD